MNIDPSRKVLLCQPKVVLVGAQFNALQNVYGGFTTLETRLDNIVAYRVRYFNISINNADRDPLTSGQVFTLHSSQLGSNVNGGNHFIGGTSLGGALVQNARGDSSIIGWTPLGFGVIAVPSTPSQQLINTIQPLSRPLAIERFDWSVRPLTGVLSPVNHVYTIEFAIEFFSECQCQTRYIGQYGSQ